MELVWLASGGKHGQCAHNRPDLMPWLRKRKLSWPFNPLGQHRWALHRRIRYALSAVTFMMAQHGNSPSSIMMTRIMLLAVDLGFGSKPDYSGYMKRRHGSPPCAADLVGMVQQIDLKARAS
jgi:hypothetical protein